MEQFTPEEQDVAARVFHRLVTPSGAKIAFSVQDLAEYEAIEPQRLTPILARLEEGSRRILRRVASRTDDDEPRYEIFHDRLGHAILAWRTRRLRELERERKQREDAEKARLERQTRESFGRWIDLSLSKLGPEAQTMWAQMMFYLISTDGRHFARSAEELAERCRQPLAEIEGILRTLVHGGVLKTAYRADPSEPEKYEVLHEGIAEALLIWHSANIAGNSPATAAQSGTDPEAGDSKFPYELLRSRLMRGKAVPFLGAGVSLSSRPPGIGKEWEDGPFLPSAREMKELMAGECAFPMTEYDRSDVSEIASFFVLQQSRTVLDELLHRVLGKAGVIPSTTHRFLAEMAQLQVGEAPLVILTTNYDTLMEQALEEAGVEHDVLAYVEAGRMVFKKHGETEPKQVRAASLPRIPERPVVFRLNGPMITQGKRIGHYSITEEDQIDWILSLRSTLPPFVEEALNGNPLLSLGQSARDWSQRALLRILRDQQRSQTRSWAVALNPSPISIMTWQRYEVEVHNADLNVWTKRMQAAG